MENNNAPFYIGQKVVALKTSPNEAGPKVIKGQIYTVENQYYCNGCNQWIVSMSELEGPYGYRITKCCSSEDAPTRYLGGPSTNFAPITPLYADIREELASQVVVGDTADSPIKVVNN